MHELERKHWTGFDLKLLAAGTMLLDHTAVVLLQAGAGNALGDSLRMLLRMAGRISFPLYGFLLVQGFLHTGNLRRYLLRLLLLGLASEIPFDLAFSGEILEFSRNNVFFTLFLGLLTVASGEKLVGFLSQSGAGRPALTGLIWCAAGICGFCGGEWLFRCDYGGEGVLAVVLLYLFRSRPALSCTLAGAFLALLEGNPMELAACGAAMPVSCYNGLRGKSWKTGFYLFYPLHLLALWLLARIF